jgi:hypothetical protein
MRVGVRAVRRIGVETQEAPCRTRLHRLVVLACIRVLDDLGQTQRRHERIVELTLRIEIGNAQIDVVEAGKLHPDCTSPVAAASFLVTFFFAATSANNPLRGMSPLLRMMAAPSPDRA